MIGFFTRLIGGKAIWWLIGSGVVVALAGAIITGAVNVGIALRSAKIEKAINQRVKEVRESNHVINQKTIDRDAALTNRLQEISKTWSENQPQQ